MKILKSKILLVAVAVLMAAFAFAGCTQQQGGNETAEGDWEYISGKQKMVIGITYFAPMNYKDDNGELTGFETEFAKAVCEKLGVEAEFIEIDWDAKETELNSKNIDCIWNGMTITEEKKQNMSVSDAYMANKQVMVVKKGNEGKYISADAVKGASVVAEKGSAGEEVAQGDEFFKDAKYTAVDSQAKVLLEVKSGTAQIGVIDYVMSIGSIGEGTDYADLVVVDAQSFADEEYGIAFRKDSNTTAKVNEAIKALAADGTLKTIAEKYKLQDLLVVK
ncbi:MAG: transporter substrate-binding domain-containing protein [Clostridia bacterium]|nr:transporter substrate-binding domain-containing protein [Clostridia bacterium]